MLQAPSSSLNVIVPTFPKTPACLIYRKSMPQLTDAIARVCSLKKVFLEIS